MQKKIFRRIPQHAKLIALGNQFRRDDPSSFWRFSTFFSGLDRLEYSENFDLEALCVMGLGRKFMQNTEHLYESSGFHQTLTFPALEQWQDALLGDCPRLSKRLAAKIEVANQKCFVFTAGKVTVWLPKLELARKLFFHAGFMVRAAYLPNGLDNLFQISVANDKFSYEVFTPIQTGVPIAFLKQSAYREFFSWLLVNKDIRNSFESIWQKLNAEQVIKNGYCRWVFNFNPPSSIVGVEARCRGIYDHDEQEMLVWEIASLSGLPYNNPHTVIFSHPQLKQPIKNGGHPGSGSGGHFLTAIEINTEDEPSSGNERVRIELPSESLSFAQEIKTKINYQGQRGSLGGKRVGDGLSDEQAPKNLGVKDDAIDGNGLAGDFEQLGKYDENITSRYAERFTVLIAVINQLSQDQSLSYLGTKIETLPVVKRCSYHRMKDGNPRCYLLAKFKRADGNLRYILDIDTSDGVRSISTQILHSCPDFYELLDKTLILTLRRSLNWNIAKPLKFAAVKHPELSINEDLKTKRIESWGSRLLSSLNAI